MAPSSRPADGSRSTRTSGRRRRSAPVAVSKPRPWGTIALSALLAVALGGILVYAAMNQGAAAPSPLRDADKSFPGLQTFSGLKRDHVSTPVSYPGYPGVPPAGGQHNAVPQTCQTYDQEISPGNALHSLEHGAVWVTYRPDLPADQVQSLAKAVQDGSQALLSPLPGQTAPVVLTAWERRLTVKSASDGAVSRFVDTYSNGPQSPEKNATCQGTTATAGAAGAGAAPAPGTASPGAASPQPSATPSPAPSAPVAPAPAPSAPVAPSASATP